jgi:hypothetical protein
MMSQPDRLEVELLLPSWKRRTISVAAHEEWIPWLHRGPAQTRKESEVSRIEKLLDEIDQEGGES